MPALEPHRGALGWAMGWGVGRRNHGKSFQQGFWGKEVKLGKQT